LVAPENRIVLDYGTEKKLVLITVRDNDTDEESLPTDLGFECVEKINKTIEELVIEKKREDFINKEGFVIRFSNGFRVKVKYEQYFILHRLVTGLSKKYVWEFISEGKELVFDSMPDEFFQQVQTWKEELLAEYDTIEQQAKEVFTSIHVPTESRKDFAMKAMEHTGISGILFKMWTKQPYHMLIWKQLEPNSTGSIGFNSFKK
jgi:RNA ligase